MPFPEEAVNLAANAFRTQYGAGRVRARHRHLKNILVKRKLPQLQEMLPFREGDKVIVTKGATEDVGKTGFVRKVDFRSVRLLIEGVGMRLVRNSAGDVYHRQRMIDMRNVRFLDPKTGAPTEVKWMWVTHPDGRSEKERIARSGSIIPKPVSPEEFMEVRGDPLKDTPLSVVAELSATDEAEIEKHALKQLELLEQLHCDKLHAGWVKAQQQHQEKLRAWRQFKFEVYIRAIEILRQQHGVQLPLPPTFRMWAPIPSRPVPVGRKSRQTAPDEEPAAPPLSKDSQDYFASVD
eukprot:EG_transcript_21432